MKETALDTYNRILGSVDCAERSLDDIWYANGYTLGFHDGLQRHFIGAAQSKEAWEMGFADGVGDRES
jgi:hypothetical protein